ncbi:MAG: DUF4159 domain-containing protein, partial [Robiginitomaculum sp.]
MSFGPLTFLAPLGLLGLLLLPLIFWLLKATPPSPKSVAFPPLRILADVISDEETPDKTPPWLLLFRLGLIALLAVALARPILQRNIAVDARPLVLVVDNGYGAASNWTQITREAEGRIAEARRQNMDVALAFTRDDAEVKFTPAGMALDALKSASPLPLGALHKDMVTRLEGLDMSGAEALWLSGGIDYGEGQALATALAGAKSLKIIAPHSGQSPIIAGAARESEQGLSAQFLRLDTDGAREAEAIAYGADGRVIARAPLSFAGGDNSANAQFELPATLRNRVSRISLQGARSAAAVTLLDDSWGRPVVGIIASGERNSQPLLDDLYYVENALGGNAGIYKAPLAELLTLGPSILIMSDSARTEDKALTEFVEAGGMLIRFAGPKLAARTDELLPVELRFGGRAMGGALTWEDPQNLDIFDDKSPFYGLAIPDDVTVTQQVMAQPGGETDNRTWARLTDGSPIVTAAARGQGRIVLFHVTSDPQWSNLAVSGLYVDMLKRLLPLARQTPSAIVSQGGSWAPQSVLSGFGRLTSPPAGAQSIVDGGFASAVRDEQHLPGLYRQGARLTAFNAVYNSAALRPISALQNVTRGGYSAKSKRSLTGALLAIGLGLLGLDALFALLVSGRLKRAFTGKAALSVLIAGFIFLPQISDAQSSDLERDTLGIHLAYVITGNSRIDRMSEAGLRGVTYELTKRTTVEPLEPRGVEIETAPLSIYPLLYWPVTRDAPELSKAQSEAVNRYMAAGGTVFFDTQDEGNRIEGSGARHPGLARISKSLDIPPLTTVPDDHVLTKSFFLLSKFVGRWESGALYIDASNIAARDGVASVIVGSNDFASAWAVDADNS